MDRSKAHESFHRFGWLATDLAASKDFEMAGLLAPSILNHNLMVLARANQMLSFIDLITLSYQTISLDHVLIGCTFGAVIATVHGYHDTINGVCGAAWSDGYCTIQLLLLIKTFALRVPKHPLRPEVLKRIGHDAPFPLDPQQKRCAIVDSIDLKQ